MIAESTLFILGAGASYPYGFPLGAELTRRLCSINSPTHDIASAIEKNAGVSARQVVDFSQSLLRSKTPSVDLFLSTRNDMVDVGKLAIAYVIASSEDPSRLHRIREPVWDDWFSVLWNRMREGATRASDVSRSPVSFITFNYDRSLEYLLHHAFKESFNLSTADAETARRELSVLHMYGQIGEYAAAGSIDGRPYAPEIKRGLAQAAKGITIVPEQRQSAASFVQARQLIAWATRICFLGFGFDQLNVERLSFFDSILNLPPRSRYVCASVLGLQRGELAAVQRWLLRGERPSDSFELLYRNGEMSVRWEHFDMESSVTLRSSRMFI